MRTSRPAAPLIVIVCALVAGTVFAQTEPVEQTTIPVPLVVNGRRVGEIPILIVEADFTERVSIVPVALVGLLPELAPDTAAQPLLASTDWTALDAFDAAGLSVAFDPEEILVRVRVPAQALRPVELPLSGRTAPVPRGIELPQAEVSAIANLEGWARYSYEQSRFDYRVTPDVALNLYGAAIEVKGGLRSAVPIGFLDHARLTWDLPELHLRLQAGDLRYRTTRLERVTRITGVSFTTDESLGHAMVGQGGVTLPIIVPDRGTVLVTRNGSQVVRRTLDPGNYLLSALPLVQGINEITVTWPGPDGPTTVDLLIPHDTELVRPGRLDAGLAVGVANRDLLDPLATAAVTYGVAQPLTIGVRFGSAFLRTEFDAGVSAVIATQAGAFRIASDVGIGPDDRLAVDVPIGYRLVDSRSDRYRSIGATAGFGYTKPPAPAAQTLRLYASGYVGFAFADGFSLTPRLSYSMSSTGDADGAERATTHDVRFVTGLRRSVRGGASLSANVGLAYREELNFLASVSYSASFPDIRQNLFLQQDLTAGKASVFWSRYAGDRPRDVDWTASAQIPVDRSDLFTVGAQVGYRDPFVRGSLSHGLSGVLEDDEYRNATSLTVASALLFADGAFALSTPVTDSFVLVAGDPDSAVPVGLVRPTGYRSVALGDRPLVFGGVRSYSPFQIEAEPLEIVLGAEERERLYYVLPSYRSGTLVRIAIERNVYVGGVLLDRAERPVGFALGAWERTDDPTRSGEFFTDGEGYFEVYSLAPGSYRLRVAAGPGALNGMSYEFTIPPGAPEYVDLGNLIPTGPAARPANGGQE
ncbi:MAG: hypothetical protein EA382_02000 [Spirochaetaceae bacterium]|nr:MAG: hypothetical protein EA382_02000 [Spirochaetaceae bacterium]